MKKRILITGASGFVGYHLVEAALQAGLEVYAAVRTSSDISHLKLLNIKYTILDYTDVNALTEEMEDMQYTYIIHAAGITKAKNKLNYVKVNAIYTRNLAIAAQRARIPLKKFVYISSLAALGPTHYQDPTPIHEQSFAHPVTDYGRSKLMAEKYLAELTELPWVVIRPTAVYGPREKDIFMLLKTLNKRLDPYISRQMQRLSFIHVQDLARVAIQALQLKDCQTFFNLSDGNAYDRYALADITQRVLGKRAIRFHVPLGVVKVLTRVLETTYAGEDMPALNQEKLHELTAENWNCSIEKIRKELGFEPEFDLEKGLTQTLKWYKDNKWL